MILPSKMFIHSIVKTFQHLQLKDVQMIESVAPSTALKDLSHISYAELVWGENIANSKIN